MNTDTDIVVLSIICALAISACLYLAYKNMKLKMDIDQLKMRQEHLIINNQILLDNIRVLSNRPRASNDRVLEAINYARVKAHPDNGGNPQDFHKFNMLYQQLIEGRG